MIYSTFLINLDHHTRRRDFMERQFAALGLPLNRLTAARGADPAIRAGAAVAWFSALSYGEIGCFESHRRFWTRVVEDGLPGAYVVEDDVVVASDFGRWDFPRDVLATADIIKIDEGVRDFARYGSHSRLVGMDRALIRLLGPENSTGSYFVTARGAERLLKLTRGYYLPVDRVLFSHDSRVFWDLEVWKLDRAGAVQYRLYAERAATGATGGFGGATEMEDSISAARVAHGDGATQPTGLRKLAYRLRLVRDRDIRRARRARAAARLDAFAKTEPIVERTIGFETTSTDHIDGALPILNGPDP